jgi:hypothetical protein
MSSFDTCEMCGALFVPAAPTNILCVLCAIVLEVEYHQALAAYEPPPGWGRA